MRKAEQRRNRAGQSLVEFALVLPLLLILIVNIVNFAGFFYAFIAVANASRSASDYAVMGSIAYSGTDVISGAAEADLSAPATASGTTGVQLVANMLATDMQSLPNSTSINVRLCYLDQTTSATACNVCTNNGTSPTMSCSSGSGPFATSSISDNTTGEGSQYTMTWVDVNYTYNPIVPLGFAFPGLGLGLTLPSNLVLHRQSVFRVLN
jgi:Flp pilus assembly protein TadG